MSPNFYTEQQHIQSPSPMAIELYYEPEHLATKGAILSFFSQGINVLDPAGNIHPQYVDEIQKFKDNHMDLARYKPHELMNMCNIPPFGASRTWIHKFMQENDYTYRAAHYARKGAIKAEAVDAYLRELSEAVKFYGRDHVLNMDETNVLLNNYAKYTIAKKGQKDVTIDKAHYNEKAGTTYIGTISMDPSRRFPLYCVAKGKTKGCEKKYHNDPNKSSIDHSPSGWSAVEIMKRYLHWLSDQMNHEPFALVLDIYTTHIAEEVKQTALDLNIKCIYVPANGTGTYQPLDLTIFGIVKKKLAKKELHSPTLENLKTKEKYAAIHEELIKIWDNISISAINSSWDIPNLIIEE